MLRYVARRCPTGEVRAGMYLGKDILLDDTVALSKGIRLTDKLVERLAQFGIDELTVYEKQWRRTPPARPERANIQEQFFAGYEAILGEVKAVFDAMRCSNRIAMTKIRALAQGKILPLIRTAGVINHLHMLKRSGEYLFHHSLNVAIICGLLGRWLGFGETEMDDLVLTGLLHDVGKTRIDADILNKPAGLSAQEMRLMKQHAELGFKMMREWAPEHVCFGILQHHERLDGSGYPFAVGGRRIGAAARIIAVADTYDSLTSDRVYQSKINSFVAVDVLLEEMFYKLDVRICSAFMNHARDYFTGNIVELSDGRRAKVVQMGHFLSARPMVRVKDGSFIDLAKEKDLGVAALLRA